MDRDHIKTWMEGYLKAWRSNEPEDIGHLFTPEALYYTAPYREPWRGREGIVAGWLGRKDEQGGWNFRYEILTVVDHTAFIRGWTNYHRQGVKISNLWIIRFDDGRCAEFVEWWMEEK